MKLEEKVTRTITQFKLLKKKDRVIVATSGGPDSVCLLVLLNKFRKKFNLYLHIASLNHLLRNKEAKEDIEFVKRLAKRFDLPLTTSEINVKQFAKENKLSQEEAARFCRFSFLKMVAAEFRANKIALGHNCDDQVETFLMRLIRGAGLIGLCGMSAKRKEDEYEIIRPLIEISRGEIENYLKQNRIKFRIDRTNLTPLFLRNKIRGQLIPLLEREYNPKIKEAIFRSHHSLNEAFDFLNKKLKAKTAKAIQKKEGKVYLKLKNLKHQPPLVISYLLRKAIFELRGNLRQFSYRNWLDLQKLVFELQSGKCIILPQGIRARKIYDILILEGKKDILDEPLKKRKRLKCPGNTIVKELDLKVKAQLINRTPRLKQHSKKKEFFDADKIKRPLYIRTRKEKDKFRPLGMKGKKSIKEFLIDEKIPLFERNKIAIIEDKKKIVWVVGLRISEEVKVTSQTRRILKLEVKKI